jgi:hypothetical protein
MPINVLLIESLQKHPHFYGGSLKVGESFKVEFPTRSGTGKASSGSDFCVFREAIIQAWIVLRGEKEWFPTWNPS